MTALRVECRITQEMYSRQQHFANCDPPNIREFSKFTAVKNASPNYPHKTLSSKNLSFINNSNSLTDIADSCQGAQYPVTGLEPDKTTPQHNVTFF